MDSATTTAAGEKPIIFQAMASDDETMVLRNIWLLIKPTPQKGIFKTFNDVPPPEDKERLGTALLGTSSVFVKSSLYTVGGRKPNSDELSSCIRYRDINKLSEGWKVGTLPSSSFDCVLGVYDDSMYILPGMWKSGYYGMDEDTYRTRQRGYIWNTIDNECLQIRIPPPEDGGKRQWRRIRACASLDKEGLLIAMDGEKNNFFLYNPENNDWKIYYIEDPLPKFIGETSFAASNGRLYILEVRGKSPPFLYIYDIKNGKGKLVMDKKPIPKFDDDLWSMDEWDREVRLVPVADDKLCFLWLGPVFYENENMWPPVRILHYLKVKFSIDPKLEVKVEDDKGFRTYITNLLDCLPCDPEQFGADVEDRAPLYFQLDAFQKQREDNSSAEEIETTLISGEPFQDQAEDIASPKEKGKGKRKRTQLVDPFSRREQKRAKDMEGRLKRQTQIAESNKKLDQLEKDNIIWRPEVEVRKAQLKAEERGAELEVEIRALEEKVRALKQKLRALKAKKREWEVKKQVQYEVEMWKQDKQLEAEMWVVEAENQAKPEPEMLEAEESTLLEALVAEDPENRFDELQVSYQDECGENEELSSSLHETVSLSKILKQQPAALPNPEMSSTFVTGVSEQGFPHNPVTAFAPATPRATCSFQRVLREIDIGKPVAVASRLMGHLPDSSGGGTINFPVRDVASGKTYEFAYYTRRVGYRKPVFLGGWRDYCRDKGLQAGDRITFSANRGSFTIVAERKMNMKLFGHEVQVWISVKDKVGAVDPPKLLKNSQSVN